MNKEVMELYQQRGVNPASGCVPMLLTMPILFAFYSMLAYSIELRGAPFAFWIKDLSVYDPFYVAPMLMAITMFVQQESRRRPPRSGAAEDHDDDAADLRRHVPVGPERPQPLLVRRQPLAIGQQYLTNWLIGPARVPRPAAERRITKKSTDRYETANTAPSSSSSSPR